MKRYASFIKKALKTTRLSILISLTNKILFFIIIFFISSTYTQESVSGSFISTSLDGESVPLIIRLPKGYNEYDADQKYRLFIFLHGSGFDSGGILHRSFKAAIDELINKEEIEPFVAVFPNLFTNKVPDYQNVHMYINSQYYGNFEDVITKDLLEWLSSESTFNLKNKVLLTRKTMALCGFSMGGIGSTGIGLRNPQLFGAIGSFSGVPSWDLRWLDERYGNWILNNEAQKTGDTYTYSINSGVTQELYGVSAAFNDLKGGMVQFIMTPQGGFDQTIHNVWKQRQDSRTLIKNGAIYTGVPGPYIYIYSGEMDWYFESSEIFATREWPGLKVDDEYLKFEVDPEAGHEFSKAIAKSGLKWMSEKLGEITTHSKLLLNEQDIMIYPNRVGRGQPVNISIKINANDRIKLRVANIQGIVQSEPINYLQINGANILQIKSPDIPGVHFFQLSSDRGNVVKKVLVQ